MGRSEMTGHSILVRIQNDINCFENSSCKLLWLNNSAKSCWAWHVCGLLKFLWCVACGSNF